MVIIMDKPVLHLIVASATPCMIALLLAGTSCVSPDEKACRHVAALWLAERGSSPESLTVMGTTEAECVTRMDRLKPGLNQCLTLCFSQAPALGAVFDCERTCGVTAENVR